MNLRISFLHHARQLPFTRLLLLGGRILLWSFALLSLTFLLPERGFDYLTWTSSGEIGLDALDGLGGTFFMLLTSLLPVLIALEAWFVKRYSDATLNRIGLAVFGLTAVFGVWLSGFGVPTLYAAVLEPQGLTTTFPYVMILTGLLGWSLLAGSRRLLAKQPA